jgi:Putative transposase/Transposase zinc-binding domain
MTPTVPKGRTSIRPALELADVIQRFGGRLEEESGRSLSTDERRVLSALSCCRTAALGGHVETCNHCQHQRIAYNSCRNRHCPKCQGSACARWMESQATDLLPVQYFHVVFTLPSAFNRLALANKRTLYGILFDAVSETLLEVAADPRNLGARIGFIGILHTWGQNLSLHPHVHCVVPGGGLSPDGSRWIGCRPGFFLPVRVLSRVFRGKFIEFLKRAHSRHPLSGLSDSAELEAVINSAVKTQWVVYAKPPFGGPEQVLRYLSRYTHRIAFSNQRLIAMDEETVTFRWKDYAHGSAPRIMTLDGVEFLRRFLLHVVPKGFMRIRHFGLLANRVRTATLACCRRLLGADDEPEQSVEQDALSIRQCDERRECCPSCGRGRMIPGVWLSPRALAQVIASFDTS